MQVKASGCIGEDAARAVSEITQSSGIEGRTPSIRMKLGDKRGALDSLAKHLGLFTDKVEVTGRDGKPLVSLDTARAMATRGKARLHSVG